ncbi:MAG: bifunctional riboflavin kinase/FAD synthetase [Bacteroides graminisolvens]|jgi:riboflavin kinase / FMN adenylyltransferase|uniref:bifunctional riboflavin kinase/FAD synthetase n=1 Tax=Bacteroides graminisolvens TaxID=477666 RepID=UPI000E8DBE34|nr:bifunctional riboflavin kinase/FAD synthetase [uncultured Bacteroides sp.]MBP7292883.1 bifunctional riboflavin kinase/FAD synthetase [Bacteroides sp.]MCD8474920.1 bifunctional riboflavin kinase/FAD synthetase [Bacteroides graminisolvens]MCD8495422.1 bifunctional riboflavin kinase/FAD synthetase [Bacteroides graminisolvens]MCD8573462.1 bifunctional riboflavin kinase/FAD synthetase [Bacteroides graminisolvens]MEA4885112.1 bifunctional riboflavin kinase/FAD synthetase [Bacteroides graminisolve
MQIIDNIPDLPLEPCVATIGFFDGVHLGHRFLIEQVKELAKDKGLRSALITFPVHPRQVMKSDYRPELLTTPEEKIELLKAQGVDYCIMLDFTVELSQLSALSFMKDILQQRYNVSTLIIGYDHRFGHNRSEGFEDYVRYGQQIGMNVYRAQACMIDDLNISSSLVRTHLLEGKIDLSTRYLGYNYSIEGVVVGGYRVGRTIGFPTANLDLRESNKLIPSDGVYAVRVEVKGCLYAGMLNIGYRPTLDNGSKKSIEVHILRFDEDIYDEKIRLYFVSRIRSEMKFSGLDELIAQLKRDAAFVDSVLPR